MRILNLLTVAEFNNFNDFATNLFLLPDATCTMAKSFNIMHKRNLLIYVDQVLLRFRSTLKSKHELMIQKKYDGYCR